MDVLFCLYWGEWSVLRKDVSVHGLGLFRLFLLELENLPKELTDLSILGVELVDLGEGAVRSLYVLEL